MVGAAGSAGADEDGLEQCTLVICIGCGGVHQEFAMGDDSAIVLDTGNPDCLLCRGGRPRVMSRRGRRVHLPGLVRHDVFLLRFRSARRGSPRRCEGDPMAQAQPIQLSAILVEARRIAAEDREV